MIAGYLNAGWPTLSIPALPWVSCAAVIGNGTQENDCKSVTTGALDHGSNGFLQWRDSSPSGQAARLTNMQAYATKNFGSWQALEGQCAFFASECMAYYKSLWNDLAAGTKSLATLTANVMAEYEVPAPATANLNGRIAYAETFLKACPGPELAPAPQVVAAAVMISSPVLSPEPVPSAPSTKAQDSGQAPAPDSEIALIASLYQSLVALGPVATDRILAYLQSRLIT
jgi:Phage tail lysozyme